MHRMSKEPGQDIICCAKCGRPINAERRYKYLKKAEYWTLRGYCEVCDVLTFAEAWNLFDRDD